MGKMKDEFGFLVFSSKEEIEDYLKNKGPQSKYINCYFAKIFDTIGIKLNDAILYKAGEVICTYNGIDKCRLVNFVERGKGLEGKCEKFGNWVKIGKKIKNKETKI